MSGMLLISEHRRLRVRWVVERLTEYKELNSAPAHEIM
jgi:hypothetical protein